jgi:hypothetical protein
MFVFKFNVTGPTCFRSVSSNKPSAPERITYAGYYVQIDKKNQLIIETILKFKKKPTKNGTRNRS